MHHAPWLCLGRNSFEGMCKLHLQLANFEMQPQPGLDPGEGRGEKKSLEEVQSLETASL